MSTERFLNLQRVQELWEKIKSTFGFTTDGTLALSEDKVLSVVNPVKGVSKSEYAGLTAAQKAGLVAALDSEYDTLYLNGRELVPCPITDASDIYSTSETVVGKWINGSLLYRRVYQSATFSLSAGASSTIATGLPAYNQIVSIEGMARGPSSDGWSWTAICPSSYFGVNAGRLYFTTTVAVSNVNVIAIVTYYK